MVKENFTVKEYVVVVEDPSAAFLPKNTNAECYVSMVYR